MVLNNNSGITTALVIAISLLSLFLSFALVEPQPVTHVTCTVVKLYVELCVELFNTILEFGSSKSRGYIVCSG